MVNSWHTTSPIPQDEIWLPPWCHLQCRWRGVNSSLRRIWPIATSATGHGIEGGRLMVGDSMKFLKVVFDRSHRAIPVSLSLREPLYGDCGPLPLSSRAFYRRWHPVRRVACQGHGKVCILGLCTGDCIASGAGNLPQAVFASPRVNFRDMAKCTA